MIHAGPAAAAGMTVMMTIAVDTVVMGNATTTEDTVDVMIADTTIAEVTIPEKVLSYPPDISYKWRTMFFVFRSPEMTMLTSLCRPRRLWPTR